MYLLISMHCKPINNVSHWTHGVVLRLLTYASPSRILQSPFKVDFIYIDLSCTVLFLFYCLAFPHHDHCVLNISLMIHVIIFFMLVNVLLSCLCTCHDFLWELDQQTIKGQTEKNGKIRFLFVSVEYMAKLRNKFVEQEYSSLSKKNGYIFELYELHIIYT